MADTNKKTKITRAMFDYEALLANFPRPGGEGAHVALFKAGVLGFKAGVPRDAIIEQVAASIPAGGRVVTKEEVEQGVLKGFQTAVNEKLGFKEVKESKRPAHRVPEGSMERIVAANKGVTVESIMAKSPVPLDFPEEEAGFRVLEALYSPDDLLYIGGNKFPGAIGETIRPAAEWVEMFKKAPPAWPHIMVNPLTGEPAPKKDGSGDTFRGDGNIASFRHAVVEMDAASIEAQLAFWSWAALPVRALVLSGGKSVHGWVDVSCASAEEWESEIENDLFPNYLFPLGCDKSCSNESRLSRMPGHFRVDKGALQKLIWLSPEGKAVCE